MSSVNLPLLISGRYLFSKRKKNFINIISIISVVIVSLITAALIIILSVFNGLEDLLRTLNNSFDPQIKIEASRGKSFEVTPDLLASVKKIHGVKLVTEVIEDYAYLKYRDANQVVMMKGVSPNFLEQHRIDHNIVEGDITKGTFNYAIIGSGIKYALSISLDDINPLHLYYIKNLKSGTLDPSKLYSQKSITAGAVFSIVQNFDENYVVVPIAFAEELLSYKNKRTSLEILTDGIVDESEVIRNMEQSLGTNFHVLDHQQQHKDLFKLLKTEKLFAFLALTLLLIVGSINIFFSLMMLALEKKKDVSILHAMGTQLTTIRNIFLLQGGLIAIIGTISGLVLGGAVVWLQQHFGLVSMGMESSVMEGYPVKMNPSDFVVVLIVMTLITFLISYKPASLAAKFASVQHL